MKCFVAMAFGHREIDELYDGAISEIRKSRNIEPVRVDRLEHNQDIDDRIIQEIKGADFAIADLTYARPSVYYEAGYAERAIPVIYTIRADHLTPRADDKFGNHRLHFDLQMKNVIDWENPDHQAFRAKLGMRVDYLTAPIRGKNDVKDQEAAQIAAFQSLAIEGRIGAIMRAARLIMSELGFTAASEAKRTFGHDVWWARKIQEQDACYVKANDGMFSFVEFSVHTKTEEIPHHWLRDRPTYNLNFNRMLDQVVNVRERKIECAFLPIPFLEVCHKMPEFSTLPDHKLLAIDSSLEVPIFDPKIVGEVYFEWKPVWTNGAAVLWSGRDWYHGFRTQAVPSGMQSTDSTDGFRFVYDGFKLRPVPRRTEYQLIDAIESETSFSRRLKAELAIFA